MSFDVRKAAWVILNTLDQGQRTLDTLMEGYSGGGQVDSRRDRALLQTLVYGVLRWRGRLDYIIAHFSSTRFDKINPKILNILRLGLFQIIYLDRIPDSAAVNTAVDMAKTSGAPWVVRYVNGLLRKTSREYRDVCFPKWVKMKVPLWRQANRFRNGSSTDGCIGMVKKIQLPCAMPQIPYRR